MLNYTTAGDPRQPALILLHGLFGDKANLGQLARALATDFFIVCPDLPGHGDSPWQAMDWCHLTKATMDLLDQLRLTQVGLIGHSMGGKLAMQVALHHPQRVKQLIVADMAPVAYPPSHTAVFAALNAVSQAGSQTRHEAEQQMLPYLPDRMVRLFLLKSFRPGGQWGFDLAGIEQAYSTLMGWPATELSYPGPSLFIHGGASRYVLPEYQAAIDQTFPAAQRVCLPGAGHWLHVDQPERFLTEVVDFLSTSG